ncbi:unnamed protein product, partial [Clonostachys rosea f. rosea IK726]
MAYCLMGIFDAIMLVIYGEGERSALERLRHEISRKKDKTDSILSRLPIASEAAFNSRQNEDEPVCLPDTRLELLEGITAWVDGSNHEKCIYWLNGIAGTGKSTIARTVSGIFHEKGKLGGSFFFSKGGGDLNHANKLVTTLTRHLAEKIPSARGQIADAITDPEEIIHSSLRDQWNTLIIGPLSKIVSDPPLTVLLVIDALDECDSEKDIQVILRILSTARLLSTIRLRIFITSRPENVIRRIVQKIPEEEREVFELHNISPELVERDLNIYFESSFTDIRDERGYPDNWPGMQIIKRLTEISGGLFIWASTACRFIREGRRLAKRRIETLIKGYRSGAGPEKQLDQIYTAVLDNSIPKGIDEEEREEIYSTLKNILGSIVTLYSTLSQESLALLLNIPLDDIRETLNDFHTILNITNDTDRPIRLHHPTFRDFLLDRKRCNNDYLWVDERPAHHVLAHSCLEVMSRMLKRDICGVGSPGTLLTNIDAGRIRQCIPPHLEYACLYWVDHLRKSGVKLSDDDPVCRFFKSHFLYWLEAINLMGKTVEMSAIIRLYHSLLATDMNERQMPFVKDARRFIFAFQNVIKQAPLQIYSSALAFIPQTNELKHHFRPQIHPWIRNIQIAEADIPEAKDEFNYVSDLAFTPDSRHLVSGSNFPAARTWDIKTKSTLRKFEGAKEKISSVAVSPDGRTIAAGSDDFNIFLWDFQTSTLLHKLEAHLGWINSVAFSPDGKLLLSGSMDESIIIWNIGTGRLLNRINNESSGVNSLAFSPDGLCVATGSVDQIIRIWDLKHTKEVHTMFDGHSGCINSIRFSPDGKEIVSGSDDKSIKIWNIATGLEQKTLKGHKERVMTVSFFYDIDEGVCRVASGSEDKTIMIWEVASGTTLAILKEHTSGINSVTFSPDRSMLASSSFDDGVRLWDTKTWALIGKLDDYDEDILSGKLATWRPYDPISTVIESTSHTEEFIGHPNKITRLVASSDGRWVASTSRMLWIQSAMIKLWLRGEKHWGLKWVLNGHSAEVNDLIFSPDSRVLVSVSTNGNLILWDTETGRISHTLRQHQENAPVTFSSDSQLLASLSSATTIRLWNVINGTSLLSLNFHTATVKGLVFSPDNEIIASFSEDSMIALWNTTKAQCYVQPIILSGHSGSVTAVAFSSDGNLLYSCSEDGAIRLWSRCGDSHGIFPRGRENPPQSIAVSADNERLACYCRNGIVELWDLHKKSLKGSLFLGPITRKLSFSQGGYCLETDRGIWHVNHFFATNSSHLHSRLNNHHGVVATQEWLARGGEDIVWLYEQEYQAVDLATTGNGVILGHPSGA